MEEKQYIERDPFFAPGVVDEHDKWGGFIVRHYDGREFDRDGNELFDDED